MSEWIAYAELEPFGTGAENQRMGMICAAVLNAQLMVHSREKNPKWYSPADFIYDPLKEQKEEPEQQQTVADMKEVLKMIVAGAKK